MTVKNNEKNKDVEIEKKLFQILSINNSKLKPYIEFFEYRPENITQRPLGILTGFFEINEYSEDSAYIVNFLNSVLKKEYYSNSKRNVQDSFDNSLHKINIALSELAKHGNINWLGKIDSVLCVFEKNSLHFATTGNAKLLLWRNGILTELNEGSSNDNQDLHPLKTFTDVSSGRIEENDRIIILSSDVSNILSLNDIQKNLLRFENEKFRQFLKTAIGNELDVAGVIIIETNKKEEVFVQNIKNKEIDDKKTINVFSEKSFFGKSKSHTENEEVIATIEDKESKEENDGYTDTKTGHIYIHGSDQENRTNFLDENIQILKENLENAAHSLYSITLKKSLFLWKKILIIFSKSKIIIFSFIAKNINDYKNKKNLKKILNEENSSKTTSITANTKIYGNHYLFENVYSMLFKLKFWFKKNRVRIKLVYLKNTPTIPGLVRIKHSFSKLSLRQKISAIFIILFIIISPIIINSIRKEKKLDPSNEAISQQAQPLTAKEIYSREINIQFVDQVEKIIPSSDILKIFPVTDGFFAVSENNILLYNKDSTKTYAWPEEYGKCKTATYMNDLNLIFLLTERNEIIEFSAGTKIFKKSVFSLPPDSEIGPIHTYLTYLYIVDKKGKQIYRYPRAEGGFGEKTNWLKEEIDLSWVTSIAIDENLYLAGENDIKKLFSGKRVDFQAESSFTEIQFNRIYSSIDNPSIFVLDKKNSRLIIFDKNGKLEKQYHHESIGFAKDFTIDTENKKAYIATDSEINSLQLN